MNMHEFESDANNTFELCATLCEAAEIGGTLQFGQYEKEKLTSRIALINRGKTNSDGSYTSSPIVVTAKVMELFLAGEGATPLLTTGECSRVTGFMGAIRSSNTKGEYTVGFSGAPQEIDKLLVLTLRFGLGSQLRLNHYATRFEGKVDYDAALEKARGSGLEIHRVKGQVDDYERYYAKCFDSNGNQYLRVFELDQSGMPMGDGFTRTRWDIASDHPNELLAYIGAHFGIEPKCGRHWTGCIGTISAAAESHKRIMTVRARNWEDRFWEPPKA